MKAVYFHQHGEASVLQYGNLPEPEIGPAEVLVAVHACALNHLDIFVRRGWPSLKLAMPHILGSDISGTIAAVGAGVGHLREGQPVIVSPGLSCGRCQACLSGLDNNCVEYSVIGEHVPGGYAEYVRVPAVNIIEKPDDLSYVEAAAFPLTFLTSWHMLVAQAKIQPGETVLVLAAGSGVGVAAIQIAKLFSATVIAAAGSAAKLQKAEELGADFTINYEKEDFFKKTRQLTDGKGVDIVFENIGKTTWERSLRCLRKGGRLVTCGATAGPEVNMDLRFVFYRNVKIYGNLMGSKSEVIHLTRLVGAKKLRPLVDRVLPLKEALQGHLALERREQFGKIVLEIL